MVKAVLIRCMGPFAAMFLMIGSVSAGDQREEAIFAGGCFWCMEKPYDSLDGVISTTLGYTGGAVHNPSYKQVSAGGTGHSEAVKVVYDPSKVDYAKLVELFWVNVDPTDGGGQFCDRGGQYRSELYFGSDEQRQVAEASLARLRVERPFKDPIVTMLTHTTTFYPAEQAHQDYYRKHPLRYFFFRYFCGRDDRLEELWGNRAGPD